MKVFPSQTSLWCKTKYGLSYTIYTTTTKILFSSFFFSLLFLKKKKIYWLLLQCSFNSRRPQKLLGTGGPWQPLDFIQLPSSENSLVKPKIFLVSQISPNKIGMTVNGKEAFARLLSTLKITKVHITQPLIHSVLCQQQNWKSTYLFTGTLAAWWCMWKSLVYNTCAVQRCRFTICVVCARYRFSFQRGKKRWCTNKLITSHLMELVIIDTILHRVLGLKPE